VRRTFEQGKNLLLQSSGLTEEAYGILKCVARYPAELVHFFIFSPERLKKRKSGELFFRVKARISEAARENLKKHDFPEAKSTANE
jgi:hypothetical protein